MTSVSLCQESIGEAADVPSSTSNNMCCCSMCMHVTSCNFSHLCIVLSVVIYVYSEVCGCCIVFLQSYGIFFSA